MNTLSLVEFLLKNGSKRFQMEIEEDQFIIKKYRNYRNDDDVEDLDSSIQTLVGRICSFFENHEELKTAKEEAKKLRNRIQGFSGGNDNNDSVTPSDSKYQGFSSDSYQNEKFKESSDISLEKRLGLEPKENRSYHHSKNDELEKKAQEISGNSEKNETSQNKPISADFDDFLSENVIEPKGATSKPKVTSKILPPPPKKNQNRIIAENTPKSTTNHIFEEKPVTQANDDPLILKNSESEETKPNNTNVDKNNRLMDFDLFGSNGLPQNDKKIVFEESSKPVKENKNVQNDQLDFDMFNFTGSTPSTQSTPQQVSNTTQSTPAPLKPFNKLPPPPKRETVNPTPQDDSDFLF